jgi:hypothetical protein
VEEPVKQVVFNLESTLKESLEAQLAPYRAYVSGEILASVLVVKGTAGAAERAGGAPVSGAVGEALEKALAAGGWPMGSWCGLLLAPLDPGVNPLEPAEFRLLCEIIDPQVLITLDEEAERALVLAFASQGEKLGGASSTLDSRPGAQTSVLGRRVIRVENFEEALGDADAKQRPWAQLKTASPSASS